MSKHNNKTNHHICKSYGYMNVNITTSPIWTDYKIYKYFHCSIHWYICEIYNQRFARSQFSKMNKHFKLQHSKNFNLKQNDCGIIKYNLPGTEGGNCIKVTE